MSWEEQYAVFRQQHGAPAEAVRRAGPIVLDGRLEEADWQRAPAVSDFRIFLNQEQKPKAESRVRLLYDDDALYLAAEALEPRPDRMVTAVTAHDGPVWQDNNFEFFFAPPGLSPRYVHWVVNAAGAVYDALTVSPQDSDVTHRLDAEFKTAVKGDRWIVEVRVPFAALGGRPGPGEVWKINVARGRNLEDGDGNELSSWSAGAVHGAEGYRRVVFQPADPRPVAGAEGTP